MYIIKNLFKVPFFLTNFKKEEVLSSMCLYAWAFAGGGRVKGATAPSPAFEKKSLIFQNWCLLSLY